MDILYSDDYIVVCVKPVGILSQADSSGGMSMITELSKTYGCEIYPLHRLDKGVTGVMVYAKTKLAAGQLSRDIAEHRFKKEYLAVINGIPDEKGEMVDLLFKDSRKNKSFVVNRMRKGVKEAKLEFERLKTDGQKSLVRVLLHTGRTHQIRVQFSSRKMSLLGDKKYGSTADYENIALMSYRLTFDHPKTKEKMIFTADDNEFINTFMR
ncbi:MAG: RluA family pseudouridine synthase [Clostridia bacterium]|nr:RluA family pseudouridine synthase [Clostridia bacterium]